MGEAIGAEYGFEGGSSGEISGGKLEVSVLVESLCSESGTELGSSGEMTGG